VRTQALRAMRLDLGARLSFYDGSSLANVNGGNSKLFGVMSPISGDLRVPHRAINAIVDKLPD
jgi:hypothetical protein